jgi:hypothetical protein
MKCAPVVFCVPSPWWGRDRERGCAAEIVFDPGEFAADRDQHPVQVSVNLRVVHPEDPVAFPFEETVPPLVALRFARAVLRVPVHFDHQSSLVADEIRHIRPDRNLPAEHRSEEAPSP